MLIVALRHTNDTNIGLLIAVVRRGFRNTLYPVLDSICKVRHNLNRPAQIITATLLLDNVFIHLTGCNLGDVNIQ